MGKSDIEGKYALVTGSSKGIGRAVALMLGEMGVNVAVNYNNSKILIVLNSQTFCESF